MTHTSQTMGLCRLVHQYTINGWPTTWDRAHFLLSTFIIHFINKPGKYCTSNMIQGEKALHHHRVSTLLWRKPKAHFLSLFFPSSPFSLQIIQFSPSANWFICLFSHVRFTLYPLLLYCMTWEVLCVNVSLLSQFLTALNSGNSSSTRVRKEKHQIGGLLRHRNRKMALLSIKTFDDSWEKNEKCYFLHFHFGCRARCGVFWGEKAWKLSNFLRIPFLLLRKLENSISITFSFLCIFHFLSKSFFDGSSSKSFFVVAFYVRGGRNVTTKNVLEHYMRHRVREIVNSHGCL